MEEQNLLLKPKNDVVFHALFREENKRITESLISDILGEKVILKKGNKDRHLNIKTEKQKLGIIDLRTEFEDGTKCNIELQLLEHKYENERFLYYWADSYSRQLVKGDEYGELHKTISIIILDHEIEEMKESEKIGLKWQIRDEETGKKILTDHLEIVIIEIPKALRLYKKNKENRICQWMLFFNNPNEKEVLKIMEENEDIKEAVDELTGMSKDEELQRLAFLREKAIRDEKSIRRTGLEEGIEKGKEEGLKLGIEQGKKIGIKEGIKSEKLKIAKNMLKKNINIKDIIEITGLTEEEINQIE